MTYQLATVEAPVKWVPWHCSRCSLHLANYDEYKPCHLFKTCPRCKHPNEKNWDGKIAA